MKQRRSDCRRDRVMHMGGLPVGLMTGRCAVIGACCGTTCRA